MPAGRSVLKRHLLGLAGYYVVLAGLGTLLWRASPATRELIDLNWTGAEAAQVDSVVLRANEPATSGSSSAVSTLPTAILPAMAMVGALLLTIPVAWVHVLTRRPKGFRQSLVHTLIILPIAVAGMLVLVQHSITLAFSLAGIVATGIPNHAVRSRVKTGMQIAPDSPKLAVVMVGLPARGKSYTARRIERYLAVAWSSGATPRQWRRSPSVPRCRCSSTSSLSSSGRWTSGGCPSVWRYPRRAHARSSPKRCCACTRPAPVRHRSRSKRSSMSSRTGGHCDASSLAAMVARCSITR